MLVESFPLDALGPGGVRGTTATGSILTTFRIEEKKTRRRLKSEPKGPSERNMQIYELHKVGKTTGELADMFGLSEPGIIQQSTLYPCCLLSPCIMSEPNSCTRPGF